MSNILVFAPHADDEILGCGGTMLRHIAEGDSVYVCIVTHAEPPIYEEGTSNTVQEEARKCHEWMGVKQTLFLNFPTVMLEKVDRYKLNEAVLNVVLDIKPETVYIPHYGDMQRDHQVVADACMVALRPKYSHKVKYVYGYETLSETGWNAPVIQNEFMPNVFVDITNFLENKKKAMSYYKSQLTEYPGTRSIKAIEALAIYRGTAMYFGAAEAFMLLREIK